jgi:hypothetical protein
VKKIDKETQDFYKQMDALRVTVEKAKADVYAAESIRIQPGLVEENLQRKVAQVVAEATTDADEQAINFNGTFTEQERDDLEIERARLETEKMRELKAIDVQVEEELDSQIKRREIERFEAKQTLQRKIQECSFPDEKQRLLEQMKELDMRIQVELEDEQRNQDKILEERRKRKLDRMAIRKLRIEHDQQNDLLSKELGLNN